MNHPRQCSNLPPDANSRFLAPKSAVIAGPGRETLEAHLPEHEVSESSTLQYLRNNRWRDGAVVRRASVPTLVKKRCKHVQCRLPEIHAMPVGQAEVGISGACSTGPLVRGEEPRAKTGCELEQPELSDRHS